MKNQQIFNVKVIASGFTDEQSPIAMTLLKMNHTMYGERKFLTKTSDITKENKMKELFINCGMPLELSEGSMWADIYKTIKIPSRKKLIVAHKPGFVGCKYIDATGTVFGPNDNTIHVLKNMEHTKAYQNSEIDELDRWKKSVGIYINHSSRLALAACTTFAGLIYRISGMETGGFHFYGPSSIGKSTTLKVANSILGVTSTINTWAATDTGIEELAERHNDSTLLLDEIGLIDRDLKSAAKRAQNLVYSLCEGTSKHRSKRYQSNNSVWRLSIISAGEISLNDLAKEGGIYRRDGETVRIIDIPALVSSGYDIFESLPSNKTSKEIIDKLRNNCNKHNGIAKKEFLNALTNELKDKKKKLLKKIDTHEKYFLESITTNKGMDHRIAQRFAQSYAAGCLAIDYKVLPIEKSDLFLSIKKTYQDYKLNTPKSEDDIVSKNIKSLRKKIVNSPRVWKHNAHKIEHLKQSFKDGEIIGVLNKPNGSSYFAIHKRFIEKITDSEHLTNLVITELERRGFLSKTCGKRSANVPAFIAKERNFRCLYIKRSFTKLRIRISDLKINHGD